MTIPTWDQAKDPDDVQDYALDWTDALDGESITTVLWTIPTPLVLSSQRNTASVATARLSGGASGNVYDIVCHVTTSAGRELDRTCRVRVKNL